jgi:formylglycine-generating enzyme required for sulfatase activity
MQMPWDWPAEVNNLEARAFCKWKSEKTERNLRLPTEDEYYALRNLLK